jgi:hypothetical protein
MLFLAEGNGKAEIVGQGSRGLNGIAVADKLPRANAWGSVTPNIKLGAFGKYLNDEPRHCDGEVITKKITNPWHRSRG